MREYEILFAADEPDDAALPVIREICARYPHVPSRILITGQPPWPNAPNYCFHRLTEVARMTFWSPATATLKLGRIICAT